MLHPIDEKLEQEIELEKDTYICEICEGKIILDDETNTLPKCHICNEAEYYKTK